jgi:hypothetical protein
MTDRAVSPGFEFASAADRCDDVVALTARASQSHGASGRLRPDGFVVACDYVIADASCTDPGRFEIADLIICDAGGQQPARIAPQLANVLRRYPGCAVAAAGTSDGGCVIAAGCGTVVSVSTCGLPAEPGLRALAWGSFAQAWLCAGRPLAVLGEFSLRVVAGRAPARPGGLGHGGPWSCSLREAGGSAGGWWLACRCRTWSASAALRSS